MRLSILAAALAASSGFVISATHAEDSFQSFSFVNYQTQDVRNGDSDRFGLNSRYYFDARKTLGPLNEFDYINTISNLGVSYSYQKSQYSGTRVHADGTITDWHNEQKNHNVGVGGEWFVGSFLLGGGVSYTYNTFEHNYQAMLSNGSTVAEDTGYKGDDKDTNFNVALGYLITENFLVKASFNDARDLVTYSASYNLDLNDSDYIGFSYYTNEDFDVHTLTTKYFASISTSSYIVLGASYTYDDSGAGGDDDFWSINSSYYFNKYSSVSASYGEDDDYSVGVNHYFSNNFALGAFYSDEKDSDNESWGVNFTAQF